MLVGIWVSMGKWFGHRQVREVAPCGHSEDVEVFLLGEDNFDQEVCRRFLVYGLHI